GDPRRDRPHPCQAGCDNHRRPRDCLLSADDRRLNIAFSSEVGTGSREENASKEERPMTLAATIRIQEADFDIAREIAALTAGRSDVGAVVTFSGICRGSENGEPIAALTLEHYPGMAEAEIKR